MVCQVKSVPVEVDPAHAVAPASRQLKHKAGKGARGHKGSKAKAGGEGDDGRRDGVDSKMGGGGSGAGDSGPLTPAQVELSVSVMFSHCGRGVLPSAQWR